MAFLSWTALEREAFEHFHSQEDWTVPWPEENMLDQSSSVISNRSCEAMTFRRLDCLLSEGFGFASVTFLDMLLAALNMTLGQTSTDRKNDFRILFESHGRQCQTRSLEGTDLSRSVGWFTTLMSLKPHVEESSLLQLVRKTRDQRERMLAGDRARKQFLSYCYQGAEQPKVRPLRAITFNYHGHKASTMEAERHRKGHIRRCPGSSSFVWADEGTNVPMTAASIEIALFGECVLVESQWGDNFNFSKAFLSNLHLLLQASQTWKYRKHVTAADTTGFNLLPEDTFDRIFEEGEHKEIEDVMPCTDMQAGLIYETERSVAKRSYVTWRVWRAKCSSLDKYGVTVPVPLDQILAATHALVRRHSVLRTHFVLDGVSGPCAVVMRPTPALLDRLIQVRPTSDAARQTDAGASIWEALEDDDIGDAQRNPFGVRIFVSASNEVDRVAWVLHHALTDAWTDGMIRNELAALLTSLASGCEPELAPTASFGRYVTHALSMLDRPDTIEYWKRELDGATLSEIPPSYRLLAGCDTPAALQRSKSVFEATCDVAKLSETGISPAALLSLAWSVVLSELTGSTDVVHGMLFQGRNVDVEGIDTIAGPCIRTVPVRVRFDGDILVSDLLARVQASIDRASEHSLVSLGSLGKATGLSTAKMTSTIINYYGQRERRDGGDALASVFEDVAGSDEAGLDVALSAWLDGPDRMLVTFEGSGQFAPGAEHLLLSRLSHYIVQLQQIPEGRIPANLSVSDEEKALISSFASCRSDGPGPPLSGEPHGLHLRFEEQVRKTPKKIAIQVGLHLRFEEQVRKTPKKIAIQVGWTQFLSYHDLDERANSYAASLAEHGISRGDLVPICASNSANYIAAVIGILKCGAAFVPMDSKQPTSRVLDVVRQLNSSILILESPSEIEANSIQAEIVCLDDIGLQTLGDRSKVVVSGEQLEGRDPAYVIFTSGTSGVPKGVVVEHRNILAFLSSRDGLAFCPMTQRRSSFASVAFDASVAEIFSTLSGGCLCVHADDIFASTVPYNAIFQTPSAAPLLLEADPPFAYRLICGGEELTPRLAAQISNTYEAENCYGPTEASIQCTKLTLARQSSEGLRPRDKRLSIGRPLGWNRIYILRCEGLEQVPVGCVGEICIGGPQVARGYLGNEELTLAKFPPDPYAGAGSPVARMYRTGDLGRFRADGEIEYLGRIDGQVKLRGLRIETGEVEGVILDDPDFASCTVVKVEQGDSQWLFAFVCLAKRLLDTSLDTTLAGTAGRKKMSDPSELRMAVHGEEETRAWLRREEETKARIALKLPEYMVPHRIVPMETMPRTASDKTDVRSLQAFALDVDRLLPATGRESGLKDEARPKAGSLEATILDAWSSVLGMEVDEIGLETPFSRLGGDSIRAIRMARYFQNLGAAHNLVLVGVNTTVKDLAVHLRHEAVTNGSGLPRGHLGRSVKPKLLLFPPLLSDEPMLRKILIPLEKDFTVILAEDAVFAVTPQVRTIQALAQIYSQRIKRLMCASERILIAGYSIGAIFAYEVTKLWRKEGRGVDGLLLFDPTVPYARSSLVGAHSSLVRTMFRSSSAVGIDPFVRQQLELLTALKDGDHGIGGNDVPTLLISTGGSEEAEQRKAWRRRCPSLQWEVVQAQHLDLLVDRRSMSIIREFSGSVTAPQAVLGDFDKYRASSSHSKEV